MRGCEIGAIAGTKTTDHLVIGAGIVEATRKWVEILNAGTTLQEGIGTDREMVLHIVGLRIMGPRVGILTMSQDIVTTDTVDENCLTRSTFAL